MNGAQASRITYAQHLQIVNLTHRIELRKARDWAELLLKVISIPAIVVGSIWVYDRSSIADTAVPDIQLTISTEYQRISDGSRVLFIHSKPMNIGKALVGVKPSKDGFVVTVRKVSDSVGQGMLDLERLPEFYKADLMKLFPDGYLLEPGLEHDQVLALVVPKGSYEIKAALNIGGNNKVDHTVVARIE